MAIVNTLIDSLRYRCLKALWQSRVRKGRDESDARFKRRNGKPHRLDGWNLASLGITIICDVASHHQKWVKLKSKIDENLVNKGKAK